MQVREGGGNSSDRVEEAALCPLQAHRNQNLPLGVIALQCLTCEEFGLPHEHRWKRCISAKSSKDDFKQVWSNGDFIASWNKKIFLPWANVTSYSGRGGRWCRHVDVGFPFSALLGGNPHRMGCLASPHWTKANYGGIQGAGISSAHHMLRDAPHHLLLSLNHSKAS